MGEQPRVSGQRHEQDVLRRLLREAREEVGFTAKALSLKLRLHSTYISRVERGYRTVDVVEMLDILVAIGKDPTTFFSIFVESIAQK